MKYTLLPRTELTVSRIALGCWGFAGGSMWGPQDEKSSINTIHTALDNGINFLDTAEGYGDGYSEEVIGKALQNRRQDAVIATKVSADRLQASDVKKACEASLSRLQTDYIDLYQIHWPSTDGTPTEETCRAMDDLIQEGKVRFFGVCNFARKNLTELLPVKKPASNQLSYSLLWRIIEKEIIPICEKEEMGILAYSALMHGILTGKYRSPDDVPAGRARTRHFSRSREEVRHGEDGAEELTFQTIDSIRDIASEAGIDMTALSYAWPLHQPMVSTVLAGARTPEQAILNAEIADITLDNDILRKLDEATRALKEPFGLNADMWQSPGRME